MYKLLLVVWRLIQFTLVTFAVLVTIFWVSIGAAIEPAKLTPIGTPAARHAICTAQGKFVETIVGMRDAGESKDVVYGTIIGRLLANGVSDACAIREAIDAAWVLDGPKEKAGHEVYMRCMQDAAS